MQWPCRVPGDGTVGHQPDEAGLGYPHRNQVDRWHLYQELFGDQVTATNAPSTHQGGVALIYCESEYWQVKSVMKHGPNVISFELVSGQWHTPIIGGYIPPNETTTLLHINAALSHFNDHCDAKHLVLQGDLNVDLSSPDRDERGTEIADVLSAHGFDDFLLHFEPSHQYSHRKTWWQVHQGETIWSHCDYILGLDRCIFLKECLKDPHCFPSNHLMVVGKLLSAPLSSNLSYLRGRTCFPLRAPIWGLRTKVDMIFQVRISRTPLSLPPALLG